MDVDEEEDIDLDDLDPTEMMTMSELRKKKKNDLTVLSLSRSIFV